MHYILVIWFLYGSIGTVTTVGTFSSKDGCDSVGQQWDHKGTGAGHMCLASEHDLTPSIIR